jgi:hypothetical protein
MKPSNIIVRVPEPCHEDWNKMLPDEKGKFCLSCNKSVFNFSNKTDGEIKNILLEHKDQKVCGHFKKSQVDRPLNLTVDINKLPANMSMTRFFAIALFIVFGSVLFSCTDKEDKVVGDLAIEIPLSQKENKEEMITMGQAIMPYVAPVAATDQIAFELTPEEYRDFPVLGGLVAYDYISEEEIAPENDSTEVCELMTGEIEAVPDSMENSETLDGLIFIEEVTDPDSTLNKVDSVIGGSRYSTESVINKATQLSVYPNPSTGDFTIRYDVNKRADVKVDILDVKGSIVRTVVNVNGQYDGKYNIPVNLDDFPSGIYFVNLTNNGEKFTEKVIIER